MSRLFSNKTKIIYWSNIPAPYMVERFDALAERNNISLEVWFDERLEPDRSWNVEEGAWKFKHGYISSSSSKSSRHPISSLASQRPDVFITLHYKPHFIASYCAAQMLGIKTAFYVERTFDSWIERKWWKETLKKGLFGTVDGLITIGKDGHEFIQRYTDSKQVYYVPHVVQADHYKRISDEGRQEREAMRQQLGLRGVTFAYVGRFWEGKGLTHLFDAYRELQSKAEVEISLLMVGDGVDEPILRQRCIDEQLRNVVFTGFKQKPELPRYYALADVFVFPTLGDPFGLVVNEAMACRLPVISSGAAGEIRDRIEDGVQGFIVPPADSQTLYQRMHKLAHDTALRERMAQAAYDKIKDQSPTLWAEKFEEAIFQIAAGGK